MDKIKIRNLELFANHGVYAEENLLGQKFIVSAVLYTSTYEEGCSDARCVYETGIGSGKISGVLRKGIGS